VNRPLSPLHPSPSPCLWQVAAAPIEASRLVIVHATPQRGLCIAPLGDRYTHRAISLLLLSHILASPPSGSILLSPPPPATMASTVSGKTSNILLATMCYKMGVDMYLSDEILLLYDFRQNIEMLLKMRCWVGSVLI
jgi:hypothetical protein